MKPSSRNLILVVLTLLAGVAAWFIYNETIGGRAGAMLRMAQDRNLPIEMYGKVIDQNGQPVDGAEVYLIVGGGGTFAPGSGPVRVKTDASGLFRVQAKGQEIAFISITHPKLTGARYRTRWGEINAGAQGLFTVNSHGKEYSWRSYTTPDNPFVINVWRVDKFGAAKSGSGGYYPMPNGEPSEKRGIVTSCKREQKKPGVHWRNQKGSWSITFRPINGGIQQTNDIYLNQAPDSGYQPELTIAMQRGDPNYKVNIQPARHYYYTAHNGQLYGAFSATFEPYMYDDECRVNVIYKYNKTGSRNLAVKPKY
jgi:hypothetical protein